MNNLCVISKDQYFNSIINKSIRGYTFEYLIANSALYLRNKNDGIHRILSIIINDLENLLISEVLNPKSIKARETYKEYVENNVKTRLFVTSIHLSKIGNLMFVIVYDIIF